MDFCSRHSFDKPPQAPRPSSSGGNRPTKRPVHELSEDEQLKAAMRASLQEAKGDKGSIARTQGGDDDDDEVEYVGSSAEGDSKPTAKEDVKPAAKEPSLLDDLIALPLGDEPAKGARIQIRMPDGKRSVRKFDPSQNVKMVYAVVAVRKQTPFDILPFHSADPVYSLIS